MREIQPSVDKTGQNGVPEPETARTFLVWLEALGGCQSQEALAQRAELDSRTLRRFAAGQGGRKTAARLASAIGVPLWAVHEVMLRAIAAVQSVWRNGRQVSGQAYREARNRAMEAASRISVVVLLGSRGRDEDAGDRLHPFDARVLIGWLEALGGFLKEEVARRAGLTRQTLWLYAKGDIPMSRLAVRSLVEGVGLPLWLVEGVMLPAIKAVRLVVEHAEREELLAGWEGVLIALPRPLPVLDYCHAVQEIVEASERRANAPVPSDQDRTLAEGKWRWLEDRSPAERVLFVKSCRELQSWELVERLCAESREAASDSAKVALQLALLALRVARLGRGDELFCLQLEGFAFIHLANAWRVAGRLRAAEEAFERGLELWHSGSATELALLPAWRMMDLEGSLRRDQRRFPEALERLNMAREAAPREAWGRILLNRAATLDQMGKPTAAILTLDEAAPFVDGEREPRHLFMWIGIRGANLCHLGRYREAQDLLPKAQELGAKLGRALDLLRLDWLRGRILSGVGEADEALATLRAVQEEFRKRGIAYDYALVSLEVGSALLEQGRHEEVKELALKMEWIFTREGIHQEAEAALDLFRQAVERQAATPELARKVVRFLYRAQYNTELKFAA